MSEIVTLHHNEPMTTSLAIADGVEMDHASVLKLIRNHVERLAKFGGVGFEIQPFKTNGGKQWRDVYFLNEQQSTFLVTLMRNTPIVLDFKEALVRAFFELREKAAQPTLMRVSNPDLLIPSHEADKIVASDRVFRAALRTARASGLTDRIAQSYARDLAAKVTGVDLAGMMARIEAESRLRPARIGLDEYMTLWADGSRPVPYDIEVDWLAVMADYTAWAKENRYEIASEPLFCDTRWRALWPLRKKEIEARKALKHQGQ